MALPTPAADRDTYDITIIGAGPAGLFAAFYAGFREMRTKIIEALPDLGGQLVALYPEKYIYDVPGYPVVLAKDLARLLVEQGTSFHPTICAPEQVQTLERREDGLFRLVTDLGEHTTRTVLLCGGAGAFTPNRLKAPGAAALEGRGVYYAVRDKGVFAGKRLLIVGGGDSAMDWVINLQETAGRITLIHRRDQFRAHEASVHQVLASGIDIRLWHEIKEVRGNGSVEQAVIFDNRDGAESCLDCDAVLVNIGFKVDLGPIKDWPLAFHGRDIKVDGYMQTSLPGVYAAGDIIYQEGTAKLNLIATGFSQAAIAVNMAKTYIDPKARAFPGHSSDKLASKEHPPDGGR